MTSCSAVRSGTLPISFRYMRTGSLVGALRASSSSRAERASRANSSASSSSTISTTSMFSSWRCWRMLSICSADTSTGASASITSSLVRKPRSFPLATSSRTSSIWASLAMAIWSSTSRVVENVQGRHIPSLRGAHWSGVVAFGPRLPQGSPSGLEGDQLFKEASVLVRPLHWVHALQCPLELLDDTGQAELLKPPEDLVSVRPVLFRRECLDGKPTQVAALGLVGGRVEDRRERHAGAARLGQSGERGLRRRRREPVVLPPPDRRLGPLRVLEGELERLALDPGLRAARARRHLGRRRGGGGPLAGDHGQVFALVQVQALHHRARVLGPLQRVRDSAQDRQQLAGGARLALGVAQVELGELPVQPPAHQRLGLLQKVAQGPTAAP